MAAWLIGGYFIGFGLCFLVLLMFAGIASGLSGISDDVVTFIIIGSFLWPLLLAITSVCWTYVVCKDFIGKAKSGFRNTERKHS